MSSEAYVRTTVLSSFDYKRADIPRSTSKLCTNFFYEIVDDVFEPIWKKFIAIEANDSTKYLGDELGRTAFKNIDRYKNMIENYVIHDKDNSILNKIRIKFNELLEKDKYKELKEFFKNPKNADLKEIVIRDMWNSKLRFYMISRADEFSAFRKYVMNFLDRNLIFDKALTANYKDFVAKLVYKTSFLFKKGLSIETAVERAINELLLQGSLRKEIRDIINADKAKFIKSMCDYIWVREHAQNAVATNIKYLYSGFKGGANDFRLLNFDGKIREKEDRLLKKLKPKRPRLGGILRSAKKKVPKKAESSIFTAAKKALNSLLKLVKKAH